VLSRESRSREIYASRGEMSADVVASTVARGTGQRVERATLAVWASEVANRSANRHVASDPIVHRATVKQHVPGLTQPCVAEANGSGDDRGVARADSEQVLKLALGDLCRVHEQAVCEPLRVQRIVVRVHHAELDLQRPATRSQSEDAEVPEVHYRLLEHGASQRLATAEKQRRRQQIGRASRRESV